jgi:hypothetical protein
MSALGIAQSSLVTSLKRYARSPGLWGILLIAPIGARYMISDEQGQGVAIAVGGQLPVLTSPVLGVWLGIVVSTLLLPIGFLYLRSNVTRMQPWQVEEVSAASRVAMMLGRFAADVAVLFAVLTALTLAGWVLGWRLIDDHPLDLWAITRALWMVAAPALMGLAALRILFDCLPWLRRGWGEFAYFMLWIASLTMPIAVAEEASRFSTNMYDFAGFIRPLTAGAPAGDKDFAIGGIPVREGRIALDVEAGLSAPGYAASRLAWCGIAVLLVTLGGLLYRPHTAKLTVSQGRIARLLAAGAPRPANPQAPPAGRTALGWIGAVFAEARLILPGRLWPILALVAAGAGLADDYRHIGSPAALLVLAFALSAHAGRSEAKGLAPLVSVTQTGHWRRRAAFVVAGTLLAIIMALPACVVTVSASPLVLGAATGAIAALLATGLAILSRSAFAPRLVLLIIWYGYLST